MKIEKLPSGSYRFQKMIDGKRHSFTLDHKPTKREIEELIAEKLTSRVTASNAPKSSFHDCALEYLSIKENVLSASTSRGYNSIIRNMPDWFLDMRINDIDQLTVQKLINEYSSTHSPKSVRNYHGFVSAVLDMFCPGLALKTTLPKKKKYIGYIPTSEDISRIMPLVDGTRYYVPFRLGCYGLRRSEVCALKYPDDFTGNVIHIDKAYVSDDNGDWHVKSTKSTEGERDVYIDDELLTRIKEQGYVYDGFPNSILRHLAKCQQELGIPHFRFHDLRHYFATELSQLNVPEADIMQMGGWATADTMKRVYRHSRIQNDMKTQKSISEILHTNCTQKV